MTPINSPEFPAYQLVARRLSPLDIGAAKVLARYPTREPTLAFHFPMDSSPPAPPKRRVARNKAPALQAEQLYRLAEVARLLGVPPYRLRELSAAGQFPPAAVVIPGGGHMRCRWTASQLHDLLSSWANPLTPRHCHDRTAEGQSSDFTNSFPS